MKDKTFTLSFRCLFCDCNLQWDTEKEYTSGNLIKCQECGELNDYDALIDVAVDEGKQVVAEYAKDEITKMLKKVFK